MTTIKNMWRGFLAELRPQPKSFWHNTYVKIIAVAILTAMFATAGFFGYRYYVQYRNEQAQRVLAVCLEEYVQALHGAQEGWSTVEMNARLGYEKHKGAALAPYLLALQIEALLHQNKLEDVQRLMTEMTNSIPESSPLYYLYSMERLLTNLDNAQESIATAALHDLEKLARDEKNINRDAALYFVGAYYWAQDKIDSAREYWQEIVEKFPTSSWAQVVAMKLELA